MTAPGRYAASDGSFAKSAGNAAARGGVLIVIALVIGFALLNWGFDGGDSDATLPPGGDDGASDDGSTDDGGTDDTATDDGATDDGATDGDDTVADDGGADDGATDGDDTAVDDGATDGDDGPTGSVPIDNPADVTVRVLNGSGVGGLAGERGAVLGALNYVWTAGNASSFEVTDSRVYFTEGYADEAKQVAEALSGTAAVLEQAPADPAILSDEGGAAETAAADIIVVLGTDEQLR